MPETKPDYETRPLAGLPGEADWVALREVVPAATATAALNAEHGGGEVQVVTVLPEARPAWKRADGVPVIALKTTFTSPDPGLDFGQALERALEAEPGEPVIAIKPGEPSARIQELLDLDQPFEVTVLEDFAFWRDLDPEAEGIDAAIEESAKVADPTAAVPDIPSAYWTKMGGRPYLRWALGVEEAPLLNALARLQARREAAVVDGGKYAGAFRSCGLVIPVWGLPPDIEAADLTEPLAAYRERLDEALAVPGDLTLPERRARAGLVARSVTLR
jgi:hypothetical protein